MFKRGLGLLKDGVKRSFVVDRDIGEDLAIDFDVGRNQSFDEAAVSESAATGGSADTLDPETTELTFALFTVAVFVLTRLVDGVFGVAI